MKKVTSLIHFLSQLETVTGKFRTSDTENYPLDDFSFFYRGHPDCSYELKPGIYRTIPEKKSTLIEYENTIYREIISNVSESFDGKSTIECLSLMQHYNAPTRLLDLTENPLVALYFATNKDPEKDGEVIFLTVPNKHICSYDSDRATILANLAKCDSDFRYQDGNLKVEFDTIEFLEFQRSEVINKLMTGFPILVQIEPFLEN